MGRRLWFNYSLFFTEFRHFQAYLALTYHKWIRCIFAIATYALSSAATIAEVIRAGVNSVDAGQAEAAYSIGLSSRQTFLRIILPQALYQALPNFGNLVIGYLKDTSLAFSIGVMDMSGRGQTLITLSNHALEVYISLSIIYYLTAVLLEYSFKWIEKRVKKENTRFTSIFDIEL